ncbi:ATP-binding protein [Eubacteriales bacterium OttesenSCG-928-A19]|nr:ATP-binding protein [Eubacteriales bacterium OttesenSCG-928-A19]
MFETGSPVIGSDLWGREKEIQEITAHVLSERGGGIEVYGLPRVGKTSLVKETIRRIKIDIAMREKYYFIWHDCTKERNNECFRILADGIEPILDECAFSHANANAIRHNLQLIRQSFNNEDSIDEIPFLAILEILKKANGITVCLVLDNSDNAPNNLGVSIESLIPLIDSRCFLLISISRARLSDLFPPEQLHGSKYPYHFTNFISVKATEDGCLSFFYDKLCEVVSDEKIEDCLPNLKYYCGESPLFLSIFCKEIVRAFDKKDHVLNPIWFQRAKGIYDKVIERWHLFLRTNNLLNPFHQWMGTSRLFGNELIEYGLITEKNVLTIPYLSDVWRIQKQQYAQYWIDMPKKITDLREAIDAIIDIHGSKITSLFDRGNQDEVLRLQKLKAIRILVHACSEVVCMGTDIKIPITEHDYNEWYSYATESRSAFEKIR